MICPGGGYNILAWDLEGEEVAAWLNSLGVTGIVLKYRVPRRPDQAQGQAADRTAAGRPARLSWCAARRRNGNSIQSGSAYSAFRPADTWRPAASTNFDKRAYEPMDDIDKIRLPAGFRGAGLSCLLGHQR